MIKPAIFDHILTQKKNIFTHLSLKHTKHQPNNNITWGKKWGKASIQLVELNSPGDKGLQLGLETSCLSQNDRSCRKDSSTIWNNWLGLHSKQNHSFNSSCSGDTALWVSCLVKMLFIFLFSVIILLAFDSNVFFKKLLFLFPFCTLVMITVDSRVE